MAGCRCLRLRLRLCWLFVVHRCGLGVGVRAPGVVALSVSVRSVRIGAGVCTRGVYQVPGSPLVTPLSTEKTKKVNAMFLLGAVLWRFIHHIKQMAIMII